MDFTTFDHVEHMAALTWLGKRDWMLYKDFPEKRAVSAKPKKLYLKPRKMPENLAESLVISEKELNRYPQEMWQVLREIFSVLDHDVVATLWYNTLAKALADGPKIFRPTPEQCEALEHAEARYSFADYKQPFPVITLEIPEGYRNQLKEKYGIQDTPKYVLINHNDKNKFITVSAFYSKNNIITHITPDRPEYATIEESLVRGRERRIDQSPESQGSTDREFDAAENVQRLGINFCMMMSLYTVKVVGPLDVYKFRQWEGEALYRQSNGSFTRKALEAQRNMAVTMRLVQFDQQVDFFDEIEEQIEVAVGVDIDKLHKSPRSHWRRGHFAMQPCGVGRRERKMIFRKPLLVRAKYFIGDIKDTSVTYTMHPKGMPKPPLPPEQQTKTFVDLPTESVLRTGQSIEVLTIDNPLIRPGTKAIVQKIVNLGSDIQQIDASTDEGQKFSLIVPPDEFKLT